HLRQRAEGLDGTRDNVSTTGQRCLHCLGLRPQSLVYVNHQSPGRTQPVQAFSDVVVKDGAVGDHDDRVKHRRTRIVDDTTRPVSQPRNSLRLTRPRRVLNQVTATSTTCSDVVDDLLSSPQLVVTREDQPTLITL